MAIVGDIKQKKDGSYWVVTEVNPNNPEQYKTEPQALPTESGAGFLERAKAGVPVDTLEAWQNIRGAKNVRQADDGSIFVMQDGNWAPVEGKNWTPSEIAGDIADYSGELIEDVGMAKGFAEGVAVGLPYSLATLNPIPAIAGGVIGAGLGGGAGSLLRSAASEAMGLQDKSVGEIAGDAFTAVPKGMLLEPIAMATGGLAKVGAKAVAPIAKKAVESPIKFASKYIASIATAKNPKLTERLLEESGEALLKKMAGGNDEYLRTVAKSSGISRFMDNQAYKRYNDTLEAAGFDWTMPASNKPLSEGLSGILAKNRVYKPDGSISKLSPLADDLPAIERLQEAISEVDSADSALGFKKLVENELVKRGFFETSGKKPAIDIALKELYDKADDVVKGAAKAQDVLPEYIEAKKLFGERAQAAKYLNKIFPEFKEKTIDSTIHTIENRANRTRIKDLQKMVDLEPDLKPWLDDVLLASRASNLDNQIGVMGADRLAEGAISGLSPVQKAATVLLTRPEIMYPATVIAGKTGRAASDLVGTGLEKIGEGAAKPATKELARIGTRGMMPDPNQTPMGAGDLLASIDLQPIANTVRQSYQGKLVEKMRGGIPEEQAIMEIVQEMAQKNGKAMPSIYQSVADQAGINPSQVQSILRGK